MEPGLRSIQPEKCYSENIAKLPIRLLLERIGRNITTKYSSCLLFPVKMDGEKCPESLQV
jgi:hypothetical protein